MVKITSSPQTVSSHGNPELRHSHVSIINNDSIERHLADPFHAIASDYDGVVELHSNKDVAKETRPLFIEKSIKKGLPLSFITGKEKNDAIVEIIEPFVKEIKALGINLEPNQFMVYSNNGSNIIDAGLNNQVLEEKTFSHKQLELIGQSESIQALLNIYEIIESSRGQLGFEPDEEATHFRQRDLSTICFRIDPDDLIHGSRSPLHVILELRKAAGGQNPSRFDIAKKIKAELTSLGAPDIVVSATDRSIDITPPQSGKRQALEDFAQRTGVAPDKILRIGDSPTGMDFGLLSAKKSERRGGFTNVKVNREQLKTLQDEPENKDLTPPVEINKSNDQFENVLWLMKNVITTPQVSTPWY